jgi:hypothetical protein
MTSKLFFILEPEVAGGMGEQTDLEERKDVYPLVTRLEYEFYGWLGDELLTTHPCFIVTEQLKKTMEAFGGTGYSFSDVMISKSEQFLEEFPGMELPHFSWLKIHGIAMIDDVGMGPRATLVVSEEMLKEMKNHQLDYCDIEKAPDTWRPIDK